MEDLLAKGMSKAENVLLSGCSAAGLTVILHCHSFPSLLPAGTKVKCLSDAGFFINAKDLTGTERIKAFYNDVVTTHGSAKNLPSSCTSKMPSGMVLLALECLQVSWQVLHAQEQQLAKMMGTMDYQRKQLARSISKGVWGKLLSQYSEEKKQRKMILLQGGYREDIQFRYREGLVGSLIRSFEDEKIDLALRECLSNKSSGPYVLSMGVIRNCGGFMNSYTHRPPPPRPRRAPSSSSTPTPSIPCSDSTLF